MHLHRKILLLLSIMICGLMAGQRCLGAPFKAKAKVMVQQDQQPEASPPRESENNYYDDEAGNDSLTDDETNAIYQDEEETAESPFSEIVTAPTRKERSISNDQWAKMTNDNTFRYEEPKIKEPQKESGPGVWERMITAIFQFLASGAGNIIIICLVVLIVLVIVVRVMQLNGNIFFSKKDKKLTNETTDELSDEYVPDDWEKVIREAAAAGNYRLAVRHGYRYLLSLLQQKELINYQVAKTNYQYVFELAGTQLHRPFMQLTRDYEYAWYGGFHIQQDRFEAYYRQVSDIKKELDLKG